jgi:hypothetical protein
MSPPDRWNEADRSRPASASAPAPPDFAGSATMLAWHSGPSPDAYQAERSTLGQVQRTGTACRRSVQQLSPSKSGSRLRGRPRVRQSRSEPRLQPPPDHRTREARGRLPLGWPGPRNCSNCGYFQTCKHLPWVSPARGQLPAGRTFGTHREVGTRSPAIAAGGLACRPWPQRRPSLDVDASPRD